MAAVIGTVAGAVSGVGWVSNAWAVIHPATVLDGPANNIIEVSGSAMAPDGSGGIVYRKEGGEGVAHVWVVPFSNGRWASPVQVDFENQYAATMPAIAAGDGGRLLVVWVQPRGITPKGVTLYALMSASLEPGARGFGPAVMVDPNVGEPNTGDASAVDPALAMNPGDGVAYVVYRVVVNDCSFARGEDPRSSTCDLGKVVEVRVARFDYLRWSQLGAVNRAPQIGMRNPTAENAPAIGIDENGNGIVAWQEPGSENVARIWVRRLFGSVLGNVLEASPETVDGKPVTSDADSPAVAMSPLGAAAVVYRVQGAAGSGVPVTQLFYNLIGSEFGHDASALAPAAPVPGSAQSSLGMPSAALENESNFRLSWTQGETVRELAGVDEVAGAPVSIGTSASNFAPTTINPAGGGTTAWLGSASGSPVVDVHQDYPHGAFQNAQLVGEIPGAVKGLALGGSGQGDALVGWAQGTVGDSEVVGDFVQSPPAPFDLDVPLGWVRATEASISWEAATDAEAGVTYSVYVDGKQRISGLTGLSARLSPTGLGDGIHQVQVLAVDPSGDETMSEALPLKIDANPPTVQVSLIDARHGVKVTVRDRASGVDSHATRISFGDGGHANNRATARHVYRSRGTYTITAKVRDKVGNQATIQIRVKIL